jgi:hypothetical protein
VPTGIVEAEHNDEVAPGTGFLRERFEQFGKERLVDPVRQIPIFALLAIERDPEGPILGPDAKTAFAKEKRASERLNRPNNATD